MIDSDSNIEVQQGFLMKMQGDDPPYLSVGTAVSAKYKGAFCEAKVSKVVRVVKCKVTYKLGLGTATLSDEQIKGTLRVGQFVQAKHMDKKEYVDATITKIQDRSQYTVVFDDGDITTLRRTALCLKSGRHFNESETLDQLPLTHPEHFGNPVVSGGRRGRRSRQAKEESSDGEVEEENEPDLEGYISEVGRVVCVEASDKKRSKDNWFPGLVVMPSAQPTVRINVKDEFLVRSFKDGRYYTVPQTEVTEFNQEISSKVDGTLAEAVQKVTRYLENDELPVHWERCLLFHSSMQILSSDSEEYLTDSSDDETPEEKDHFVAQLYKFMDDSNTPLNKSPMIGNKDVDLHRLFRVVRKLGGYNRVTNKNKWRTVTVRLKFPNNINTHNQVKSVYKKFLFSFEAFHRTLGVTMLNHSRAAKKSKGRSLIRDKDRNTPVNSPRPEKEDDLQLMLDKKEDEKFEEKPRVAKKVESKTKLDDERKSNEVVEVSDTNSSDVPELEPTVVMVRLRRADAKVPPEHKHKTTPISAEKAKLPVEKYEEQVKEKEQEKEKENELEKAKEREREKEKEEKEREKGQQTRSKTQIPKVKEKDVGKETVEKKIPETPKREIPSPSKTPTRLTKKIEDEKKRGRKRTTIDEKEKPSSSDSSTTDSSITQPLVGIGDKLKVYYGPNHESKVTYEAKVIEIDKESVHPMYLVHYTGWNTRYDEWITQSRIAENLSATTKAKRLRQGNSASKTIQQRSVAKRGRRISITSRAVSQDTTLRPTTPSKSPNITNTAPARSNRITRQDSIRRTRRTSNQTDVSNHSTDSDNTLSESDTIKTRSSFAKSEDNEHQVVKKNLFKAVVKLERKEEEESEKEEEPAPADKPKRVKKLRKTLEPKSGAAEQSEESDEEDSGGLPKGRDFDLNQIRSELKGLVKTVKAVANADVSEKQTSSADESILTEPKVISTVSEPETEEFETCEMPLIKKSSSSEDIYEFKEPEPFEFETRNKISEDKSKKRLVPRIFEDLEKSPRKRKSESPHRESETEKQLQKTPVKKELSDEGERSDDGIQTLTIRDDPFDKLVESPSFHSGKEQLLPVGSESKQKVTKTLNLDDSLSLFHGLPESTEDESDEQLDISDSEMPNEPLFSHKEQLFSDAAFGNELPDSIFTGFISKNVEQKRKKDSDDDEEENNAIRESLQSVINQATLSDDSNDALLLDEPFVNFPETKVDTKAENVGKLPMMNLSSAESDNDVKQEEMIEDIKQISPSIEKCSEPTQSDLIPLKKPKTKIVDSLLLKLGIIKDEDTDEDETIDDFSNPAEAKIEAPFSAHIKEGKIKTIEPRVRVTEPKLKPVEFKTTKIKTLEPKIKTLEPKLKTSEPKFKMMESKFKTIEPKLKTEVVDLKKRRKFVSREFIDESDSDSTDSEERLVIRSDDESHTNSSSDVKSAEPQSTHSDENFKFDVKSPLSNDRNDSKTETDSSNKEDEPDSHLHSLLLCEETIPGSPAPAPEDSCGVIEAARPKNKLMHDIPFASAPGTSNKTEIKKEKLVNKERIQPPPLVMPLDNRERNARDVPTVLDNTPPTTPESTLSNLSPRGDLGDLSPNALDDSYNTGEGESSYPLQKRRSHKLIPFNEEGNGDTLMNLDATFSNRKSQEVTVESSIRKRRRSFKGLDDISTKRVRKPLNRSRHNSDSDDTSEHSGSSLLPLGSNASLDNRLLRSPKPSKYNFRVELDPNLDAQQRIAVYQQTLQDIRKTYAEVKAELAAVERRRKKFRRREREAKMAAKQEALAT